MTLTKMENKKRIVIFSGLLCIVYLLTYIIYEHRIDQAHDRFNVLGNEHLNDGVISDQEWADLQQELALYLWIPNEYVTLNTPVMNEPIGWVDDKEQVMLEVNIKQREFLVGSRDISFRLIHNLND